MRPPVANVPVPADVVTAAQRSASFFQADVSAGRLEGLQRVKSSHAA